MLITVRASRVKWSLHLVGFASRQGQVNNLAFITDATMPEWARREASHFWDP